MTIAIEIGKSPVFEDPKWSTVTALPGAEAGLSVTARDLLAGQTVHFEVRNAAKRLLAVLDADRNHSQKWTVPAGPEDATYSAQAILRQKPTAANGHQTVWKSVKAPADLAVKGTKLTISKIDAAFVPKQEKLEATYKIEGTAPAKGRIEVWGERYPSKKPVYVEAFTPAVETKTWNTWHGGKEPKKKDDPLTKKYGGEITEAGVLKGLYLTPEFSPYRLRIVLGPDDEAIKDPLGKGLGKVVIAETQFEVTLQSIHVRLLKGLAETAAESFYKLDQALGIESANTLTNGRYKTMARLPFPSEKARIRIPTATHWGSGQNIDQGGTANQDGNNLFLNKPYNLNNNNKKFTIDAKHHSRPELPVEFECRLRSRTAANNTDVRKQGLFEPDAVGPIRLEPYAEDFYNASQFTGGNADAQTFWKNAAFKIKKGTHKSPKHGTDKKPIITYWQTRYEIADPAVVEYTVSDVDPAFKYKKGAKELVLYLNRARLELSKDEDAFKKGHGDYIEVTTGSPVSKWKIKLQKGLLRQRDILWVARKDSTAAGTDEVATWQNFPLGTNCHEFYGGLRGKKGAANKLFLKAFTTPAGAHDPVIGKGTPFPYAGTSNTHKYVNLTADLTDVDANERVELQAMMGGDQKGVAGVIFSPSYIAGDSYVLHARADQCPYARSFGWEDRAAWVEGKTGTVTAWRRVHIHKSLVMPEKGKVGLRAGVGSEPEQAFRDRDHLGDARNMRMSGIRDGTEGKSGVNYHYKDSFNEWTLPEPIPITAATHATGSPVVLTAPGHGLATGDNVRIEGVQGIPAANNTVVVRAVDANRIELRSTYDFSVGNGLGAAINGPGGAGYVPPTVSGATNATPIEITTAANHGLVTGAIVAIRDVEGNSAANGTFKVTVGGDATKFTLNDSDGTGSGVYTRGGRVYTGFLDTHRGINLKAYADRYNTAAVPVAGRIPMDSPARVQMEFAPYDHYRWRLPPGASTGVHRQRMARVIKKLVGAGSVPWGTASVPAAVTVVTALNNNSYPGTAVAAINQWGGTADDYKTRVTGYSNTIRDHLLALLAVSVPSAGRPRSMVVVRWPRLYHHNIWTGAATTPATNFTSKDGYTNGVCFNSGQAMFETDTVNSVFAHEMGHSLHLSHFVVGGHDFNWKHHDMNKPDCIISYDWPTCFLPVDNWPAAVPPAHSWDHLAGPGPATNPKPARSKGWHDTEPAAWPNGSSHRLGAVNVARWTSKFGPEPTLTTLCAKCALKLRGWDEEKVPCAWTHPDLY